VWATCSHQQRHPYLPLASTYALHVPLPHSPVPTDATRLRGSTPGIRHGLSRHSPFKHCTLLQPPPSRYAKRCQPTQSPHCCSFMDPVCGSRARRSSLAHLRRVNTIMQSQTRNGSPRTCTSVVLLAGMHVMDQSAIVTPYHTQIDHPITFKNRNPEKKKNSK